MRSRLPRGRVAVAAAALASAMALLSVAMPALGGPKTLSLGPIKRSISALKKVDKKQRKDIATVTRRQRKASASVRTLSATIIRVNTRAEQALTKANSASNSAAAAATATPQSNVAAVKIQYRAARGSEPALFYDDGKLFLRGTCSSTGNLTIQAGTHVDHALLRATTTSTSGTVFASESDFRSGAVRHLTDLSEATGTIVYAEPGDTGRAGESVSVTFAAGDSGSAVLGAGGPFGGTTQTDCAVDGNAVYAP